MNRLVLVDAHSVLYRSFFAFIRNPLRNSRGMNTSGIFGFANTLRKVLRELKPDYCAVVFDAPGKTFRDELYSEYKAQRPKVPAELIHSVPYAKALVQAWGVKIFEIPGYEADDVIGTFTRLGAEKGLEVVIVSSDKDLLQLVSQTVSVYDPYREKYYGVDDVKDKLGILPEQVPDYLALAGDAVDNIPGVPGIGPKRAQSILLKHGSLEVALQKEEKLQSYQGLALLSRRLAKIDTAAGIEVELESLVPGKPDKNRLVQLYQELEFSSLLRETDEAEPTQIEVVNTVLNCTTEQFVEELQKKGVAGIAWEPGCGLWVSVSGEKVVLIPVERREIIEQILQSVSIIKAGFDFKEQIKILRPHRLKIVPPFFDNCIGAWLIDPNRKRFTPADIIGQILHRSVEVRTPSEQAGWAVRVYHSLIPELLARGLTSVYDRLEMPLIPVLAQMEERGVKIDVEFFRGLERDLRGQLHAIESKIWQLAGRQFNISSPKQLREILFRHLKLPTGKKTKTGFSTSSEVLANLVSEHPIVAEILRYRELEKLCTTYLAPLPTMADPVSHRLHTRFNQWGTSTGRLSSSEPNLQNIPIRGELGEKIRNGFIADQGMVLISADYSQIELRVLAHFSEDEHLIAAFQNGEDIHVATASAILNIPPEQITPEHRRIAKMVNYGLIYGMGDWGLAARMDIPREQARIFMEEYFLKFPGVARWREQLIEVAKRDGYVRTISGRMRPIPGISSEIRQQVEMALRMALNAPMQGSAADIMKSAMIRIDQRLQEMGVRGGMILQIHDELLLEVEEEKCSAVRDVVRSEMENAWQLKVPLKVDIGVGRSWGGGALMPRFRVMISFGTRPEAIKVAPVIKELQRHRDKFHTIVVVTAQHRQMLDQVLNIFKIVPDYDLNIMTKRQSLSDVVIKTLRGLEPLLKQERPDMLLVQGDASSAFASALAGYYQQIPLGHIEAGLRTYDKYAPFPEEINRRCISAIADIHFAPTPRARENLIAEGIDRSRIYVTGNTVIDAVKQILSRDQISSCRTKNIRLLLVTLHRRESFGAPLKGICQAMATIVRRYPDVRMVIPVHPNPQVSKTINDMLGKEKQIRLIEPVEYPDFLALMKQAYLILTDSGGIQEEAPMLGKPVVILREKTERVEALEYGTAVLAGVEPEQIVKVTECLLNNINTYRQMVRRCAVFGDGKAAIRIRKILLKWLASIDTGYNSSKLWK